MYDQLCLEEGFVEQKARDIFKQVLKAINFIHSMNISHRDIKAENFVFESKTSSTIKLIDFGLSSSFLSFSESANKPLLLRMQTPVGTNLYAAPEVYEKQYTEKCDIWSAGIYNPVNLLYRLHALLIAMWISSILL